MQTKSTKQEVLSISTKSQAWYMDLAISLFIFMFTLIVYFSYTNNIQKQESGSLDSLAADARAISSSLILSGYPKNWTNSSIVRIGIADDNTINTTKLRLFKQLNYSKTKNSFGTVFDYFVFFVNNNNEVLNIKGICGVGHTSITTTYNIKSAYYYSDEDDKVMKNFMDTSFKADIYFGDDGTNTQDIDGFITNLSKYAFIVLEHPDVVPSNFNKFQTAVENLSSRGGITMLSGQLTPANNRDILGVDFRKKSGQSLSDREATINNTDQYLSLNIGENITFSQAYYVDNKTTSSNFKILATFNQDQRIAIAKWNFGNGTNYFFSDFNVSYFSGDFPTLIEDTAKGLVEGTCNPINLSNLNVKNLVKTERFLSYKSKPVKMVLYVWQ